MTGSDPHAVPRGDDQTLSDLFRQWAAFLRRRYRMVLLCAMAGLVLGGALATQSEERYESDLLLMVEPPARSPIETEAGAGDALELFIEGQVFIIQSTDVLSEVVNQLDLTSEPFFQPKPQSWLRARVSALEALLRPAAPVPADDPAADSTELPADVAYAVRTLRSNISASREDDTEIISISATADRPRLAAAIANAIGAAFVANREASQFDQAARVAGWLDGRALELQRQLSQAEDAVAAFRIENNLVAGEGGTALSEQQLTELNGELIATRTLLAERRASFARATTVANAGDAAQTLPEMQDSAIFEALRARLLELELREMQLGGAGADNRRLEALRDERATIEAQIATEVERTLILMANEIETLEAREALIVEALARAGGETGEANISSIQLRELERRAAAYSALYERYLSNAGLVDESISYLVSGVEVIEAALPPVEPETASMKTLMIFGLVLGAVIGAVLGLLRESMMPGFVTTRQVERAIDLPVLSRIPDLPAGRNGVDIVREEPMSAYAEAVRTLRHGLTARAGSDGAPVLLMTSAVPAEGKTSLAAAIATSASTAGLNVLLIDADLRRAGLSRLYDAVGDAGLTDILRTRSWDFLDLEPGAGELSLLPTGRGVSSPSDMFVGEAFAAYLRAARQSYDLVVVDGPPVANLADANLLAQQADSIGFVVRWNTTRREVVREAMARLGRHDARVGVALNAVDLEQVAQYGEAYEHYVHAHSGVDRGGAEPA